MDDLAAELRMSKKTLYACFPSKSSLVEAVLKDKFNEVEADLSRLASERSFDMEEFLCSPIDIEEYNKQVGTAVLPPSDKK